MMGLVTNMVCQHKSCTWWVFVVDKVFQCLALTPAAHVATFPGEDGEGVPPATKAGVGVISNYQFKGTLRRYIFALWFVLSKSPTPHSYTKAFSIMTYNCP
jgi:hypothetical protein